jgi:hypothetical protein
MTRPIILNLVNFYQFVVRSTEILVKLVVGPYEAIVSVSALQNNEMPIGVDHIVCQSAPTTLPVLQNNEMPIGVDPRDIS